MKKRATIEIIANKARRILENDKIFKNLFESDLCGLCAIGSFFLCKILKKNGIKANIMWGKVDGGDHCWVEVDKYVIDITATQFGYSKVEIFPFKNKKDRNYKDFKYSGCTVLSYGNFKTWVADQKPKMSTINRLIKNYELL